MMIEKYLKDIFEVYRTGDAREESYYSSLERLLSLYIQANVPSSAHITVLPIKSRQNWKNFILALR
jgi:hypothetical protein